MNLEDQYKNDMERWNGIFKLIFQDSTLDSIARLVVENK